MKVHVWIGKSRIAGKGLFVGQDITNETIITRYIPTTSFNSFFFSLVLGVVVPALSWLTADALQAL